MTLDSPELHQPEEGAAPPPDLAKAGLRDFLGALLLLGVSVAYGIGSLRMPYHTPMWVWYTSPGIFPLAMVIALGLLSLAIGFRGLRDWRRARAAAGPVRWSAELRQWGMGRCLGAVLLIAVFLALLGRVPFLLDSVGLIMSMAVTFRSGRVADALLPASIASVVIVLLLFAITWIFGVPFP